jgi:medium-chain acyl-[acyl-carrier-protein] hydrolase
MATSWIVRHIPRPQSRVRLICFPHAGGAAWAYQRWVPRLPTDVELCAVELPGHGTRIREPLLEDFDAVFGQMVEALQPEFDRPLCLFGHSLGAILAFEVARRLRSGSVEVVHLFVSGHNAPQNARDVEDVSQLDDAALTDRLIKLNCSPPAVLHNSELMRLVLPVIRADFAIYSSYAYRDNGPLSCPITTFGGIQDPHTELTGLQAWHHQTTGPFSLRQFMGDHFFVYHAEREILHLLAAELAG